MQRYAGICIPFFLYFPKAETLRDDIEGLKHELKVVRSSQAIQANVKGKEWG